MSLASYQLLHSAMLGIRDLTVISLFATAKVYTFFETSKYFSTFFQICPKFVVNGSMDNP